MGDKFDLLWMRTIRVQGSDEGGGCLLTVPILPLSASFHADLVVPLCVSPAALRHEQGNHPMIQRFGKGIDGDSLFKGYVTTPPNSI